ncbi:MAG: hypothetical protein JXA81_10060 [Sedimentisphaerales bacterium]|nr:hypothetical protein [Sedimentisphaerales bacterium]
MKSESEYKYDVAGRRIEKKVDGFSTRYVHSGGSVIAEYDGNNNLLRKYVAGPDGPVCMIEEAEGETYYYHYDGSGNVVALSDSAGDTVQTYEYSVFGQVAASDPNHPNPYMFAGMRFESETGLYFTGGPFYNPYIGRYLQQNYGAHWEKYSDRGLKQAQEQEVQSLTFVRFEGGVFGFLDLGEEVPDGAVWSMEFSSIDAWMDWAAVNPNFGFDDLRPCTERPGWDMAKGDPVVFWAIQALIYLGYEECYGSTIAALQNAGVTIIIDTGQDNKADSRYDQDTNIVHWNNITSNWYDSKKEFSNRRNLLWYQFHPLVILAHEIGHALDDYDGSPLDYGVYLSQEYWNQMFSTEEKAMIVENEFRWLFYKKEPNYSNMRPRPAYGFTDLDDFKSAFPNYPESLSGLHEDISWDLYWNPARHPHPHVPWEVLP